MTNPILALVLPAIKQAVDAFLTGAETNIAPLVDKELNVLENTVGPAFHVPANIMAFLKGENTVIEQVIDPAAVAGLEFLKARIDAL